MATSYQTKAVLNAVVALVASASPGGDLQETRKGAPTSTGKRVAAFVTVGGQKMTNSYNQNQRREARVAIFFSYRIKDASPDDVAAAEDALADWIDALQTAWLNDRTLGGLATEVALDMSQADTPQYQVRAGQEFRVYPIFLSFTQYQEFSLD